MITFLAFGNQKIPSLSKSFTTTLTTALIAFFAGFGLKVSGGWPGQTLLREVYPNMGAPF